CDGREVRADQGALDRGDHAGVQAGAGGVRAQGQPASRAGRTGCRDHLYLRRPDDRQAGEQAGRGRGSPRLRLVGEAAMSRIGRMPVAIPSGVDVTIDGRQVTVKGPKGTLSLEAVRPIEVKQGKGSL